MEAFLFQKIETFFKEKKKNKGKEQITFLTHDFRVVFEIKEGN